MSAEAPIAPTTRTAAPARDWSGDPAPEAIWDAQALRRAPIVHPMPDIREEGLTSLCFEAAPHQGRPSKVFAFLGVPDGASAANPVPGVVLVHGGLGTAYPDWVRRWKARGYAAIAFDHFGQFPIPEGDTFQRNPDAFYRQRDEARIEAPYQDQWPYHAVTDALLAHALLASLPEVDAARIGLVGVSWGAVMASITAGVDRRFQFFVPIYGCGYISVPTSDGSQFMGKDLAPDELARWRGLWDPANHLPRATAPTLWLTGTNDFAFTLRAVVQSSHLGQGSQAFAIRHNMVHGQPQAEEPEEQYVFANSLLHGGPSLPQVTGTGMENGRTWVTFHSPHPVRSVELLSTRDSGPWQERRWEVAPVTAIADGRATAPLPVGATSHFFNIIDDRNLLASSEPAGMAPFPL